MSEALSSQHSWLAKAESAAFHIDRADSNVGLLECVEILLQHSARREPRRLEALTTHENFARAPDS